MPQASDALRDEMGKMFGDRICDSGPTMFLENKGWTLHDDWTWSKPGFDRTNLDDIPLNEWLCILFLVHEWDFGGVRENPCR